MTVDGQQVEHIYFQDGDYAMIDFTGESIRTCSIFRPIDPDWIDTQRGEREGIGVWKRAKPEEVEAVVLAAMLMDFALEGRPWFWKALSSGVIPVYVKRR